MGFHIKSAKRSFDEHDIREKKKPGTTNIGWNEYRTAKKYEGPRIQARTLIVTLDTIIAVRTLASSTEKCCVSRRYFSGTSHSARKYTKYLLRYVRSFTSLYERV